MVGVGLLFVAVFLGAYFLSRPGGTGLGEGAASPRMSSRSSSPVKEPAGTVPSTFTHTLNGGGSTFLYPLMEKWGAVYRKEHHVKLNYLPSGSGAGVQQLLAMTLDFSCSDAPLTDEQLQRAREDGGDALHVPLALGGIVPAYNLEGVEKPLRFSGTVLAHIFLGEIKKWNDPALQEINPGVDLPDREITVIHRADGSGSTYIFTDFLSKVSKDWRTRIGASAAVKWPVGVGARGNEGMVETLLKTSGALAYVDLLDALRTKLKFGTVKNKAGNYIQGSLETVTATAEGMMTDIPADLRFSVTSASFKEAYTICGCTWAILRGNQPDGKGQRLVDFLAWAIQEGQEYNTDLYYARLPRALAEKADEKLKEVKIGK